MQFIRAVTCRRDARYAGALRLHGFLRILVVLTLVALCGPLPAAHAALCGFDPGSHQTFNSGTGADETTQDADGTSTSGATHHHCAICHHVHAVPPRLITASIHDVVTPVRYQFLTVPRLAEFTPPPLRKPPRRQATA